MDVRGLNKGACVEREENKKTTKEMSLSERQFDANSSFVIIQAIFNIKSEMVI